MSALRTRMIEDMQLAGLSAKTQEVYLQAVTALVKHYRNRSPDQLTEEEVRCYLLAPSPERLLALLHRWGA